MKNKSLILNILLISLIFILIINFSLAYTPTNESLEAEQWLKSANENIIEMESREIPTFRVKEIYQEASQIYEAQKALEEKGIRAKYNLIKDYTLEIESIKESSILAKDELRIFLENYEEADSEYDLKEFEEEFNLIINSFEEERFEETLILIDKGYVRISEIQSSQTKAKVIYLSTAKTIKDFFMKYGQIIGLILILLLLLYLLFKKKIELHQVKKKLSRLEIQKSAVKGLIKKTQNNYFKLKNISELEYKIKLEKYESLIRDIERQKMVLKEKLYKSKKEEWRLEKEDNILSPKKLEKRNIKKLKEKKITPRKSSKKLPKKSPKKLFTKKKPSLKKKKSK